RSRSPSPRGGGSTAPARPAAASLRAARSAPEPAAIACGPRASSSARAESPDGRRVGVEEEQIAAPLAEPRDANGLRDERENGVVDRLAGGADEQPEPRLARRVADAQRGWDAAADATRGAFAVGLPLPRAHRAEMALRVDDLAAQLDPAERDGRRGAGRVLGRHGGLGDRARANLDHRRAVPVEKAARELDGLAVAPADELLRAALPWRDEEERRHRRGRVGRARATDREHRDGTLADRAAKAPRHVELERGGSERSLREHESERDR